MAILPIYFPTYPDHEIADCRWDEEAQLYRVNVDGVEYQSRHTLDGLKTTLGQRRRSVAAFEAMARCAESRENRLKAEDERRDRIRAEVMKEAGYFITNKEGYENVGLTAKRLIDLAVEARLKLERQGMA